MSSFTHHPLLSKAEEVADDVMECCFYAIDYRWTWLFFCLGIEKNQTYSSNVV